MAAILLNNMQAGYCGHFACSVSENHPTAGKLAELNCFTWLAAHCRRLKDQRMLNWSVGHEGDDEDHWSFDAGG